MSRQYPDISPECQEGKHEPICKGKVESASGSSNCQCNCHPGAATYTYSEGQIKDYSFSY
jgi:hypothetical protein